MAFYSTGKSLEEFAEIIIVTLIKKIDKLFEGEESYSEEKEKKAEKMILEVFNYLEKIFDEEEKTNQTRLKINPTINF